MGAEVTIAMPYYRNPGMLARHYANWLLWPDLLRATFRFLIVDDGSPERADDVPLPVELDVEIYRVLEDRPWHQHAARNLAAHVAQDGWLLMTDMDHMLMPEQAKQLFARLPKLDDGACYMLDRIEADTGLPTLGKDGKPKPHPNSFLMTKSTYWRIGGYDEDFCGVYGTDRLFRDRAFGRARRGHLDIPLTRYWRDIVPDASTRDMPRKEGRDPNAKRRIMQAKAARGELNVIKVLDFEWERAL